MNTYSVIGDFLHLISIAYILVKLIRFRTCGSLSGKSQLLFVVVYCCRYLDLWTDHTSMYLTSFKLTYIVSYSVIAFLIFVSFRVSYRKEDDTFFTELLLVPCFLLSVWFSHETTQVEILWTFSVWLESVAILPQFYMILKKKQIEKSLIYYLMPLGLYKLFYIFNWVYRYVMEDHYDPICIGAGIVTMIIYIPAFVELTCFTKIKILDDMRRDFFSRNIFYIYSEQTSKEPTKEVIKVEENLEQNPDKQLLVETV